MHKFKEIHTFSGFDDKRGYLDQIIDNYLFKDILNLENLQKPQKLIALLRLLAFQIGKEVSISELANHLNLHFHTVDRYLDLLEKTWVIVRVTGFSRNLRKEVTKNHRYFWRTYDQQELDLVEESGGQLRGYEFKWSDRKKPKAPKAWLGNYDNASYQVINQDNYLEFIT